MVVLLKSIFPEIPDGTSREDTETSEDPPLCESRLTVLQVDGVKRILEIIQKDRLPVSDCSLLDSEELNSISECVVHLFRKLKVSSRTAKLWLQYIRYIDIIKQFLTAERTGNWMLHLESITDMLNLFAATGHNNYAKCARLYVQMMKDLPTTHPWLFDMFMTQGVHSVRRSDRYWAGLSTDLLIEQTMMRSLKSQGGITRGSGFEESVRVVWVLTMHHCASVHLVMSSLTGLQAVNQQHVDIGISRATRDCGDLQKIVD